MGGVEMAAKLRATLPQLGVLFLSGHAEPTATSAPIEVRDARFLQKPFEADALLAEVRQLLEGT
jgi:FixJ family two-component response regulator